MTLAFTVFGVALPKGNLRAFHGRGMKFPIVTETNRSVKSWQQLIAAAATTALEALPPDERRLVTGGVRCAVTFYLPRPKALSRPIHRSRVVAHTTAPDIDKLARAVLDALTAVVWHDDAQVVDLVAAKRYAGLEEPARAEITVTAAPQPAPRRDPAIAQADLQFELAGPSVA